VTSSIALIGVGARGLSVMERIAATAAADRELTLHIVDPGPFGVGVHAEDQDDNLLLNTVAGQITMFRRGDPSAGGHCIDGPSLAEWAGVARDTYLPRRMLGGYLKDAYRRLRTGMPASVTVVEHRAIAEDLSRLDDGTWAIGLSDGSALDVGFVVLATGHGSLEPSEADAAAHAFVDANRERNPALAFFRTCYPLDALSAIRPGARVGLRGMGLAAIDAVLALTLGRRGHFAGTGPDLVYLPSGAEPRITAWSRHGRAFWPRARNEKAPRDVHHPARFDIARVHALRDDGPRDFALDYVPLLIEEMTAAARRVDPDASIEPLAQILTSPTTIDGARLHDRVTALGEFFAADERRAEAGNMSNAQKSATDAIRDLRNEIREAVEHAGLTPESHRAFVEVYAPLLHVMSAGPPALRAREWRALMAAGVLTLGPIRAEVVLDEDAACFRLVGVGDEEVECDVIVGASVDAFLPERDDAPLTRSILERGYGRPFRNGDYHPGGWDIDRLGRLRDASGAVIGNLCAVGNPTEGPHYFTNMLPAPGLPSRITADAQHVVEAIAAWSARAQRGESPIEAVVA
jgi:uncharacterized NAD(P)/FAD-binding protein YdhS